MSDALIKSRRAAREAAFQAVYQCMQGGGSIGEAVGEALSRQSFSPEAALFVRELAEGAVTKPSEIDSKYSGFLKAGWGPDRLAMIDLLVLRLAVFELWFMPDVPPKVTITEAVSLAKRFGSEESGRFVNGVLAKVLENSPKKDMEGRAPARPKEEVAQEADPPATQQDSDDTPTWTIRSDD